MFNSQNVCYVGVAFLFVYSIVVVIYDKVKANFIGACT